MSVLKKIKTSYLLKYINKVAPGLKREKCSKNLTDIREIGIVLDGTRTEFMEYARQYAKEQRQLGRKVEILAYVPKIPKDGRHQLETFTQDDLNWYEKPVAPSINNFMDTAFDLLINLTPNRILPLEYICALSSSRLVIGNGVQHLNSYYDCLIKVNNSNSPSSFMENLHHYLNLQR